jgi:hypothetical protein
MLTKLCCLYTCSLFLVTFFFISEILVFNKAELLFIILYSISSSCRLESSSHAAVGNVSVVLSVKKCEETKWEEGESENIAEVAYRSTNISSVPTDRYE